MRETTVNKPEGVGVIADGHLWVAAVPEVVLFSIRRPEDSVGHDSDKENKRSPSQVENVVHAEGTQRRSPTDNVYLNSSVIKSIKMNTGSCK